jgi:flagellar hook-length control protein FliK
VDQVVARLSQLAQGQSAVVSLEPPELGRVLVRFVRRGKGWKVQIVADSREVAQALTRDLGRLSQVLGREAEGIDVEVSADSSGTDQRSAASQDGEERPFGKRFPDLPVPPAARREDAVQDPRAHGGSEPALSTLDVIG